MRTFNLYRCNNCSAVKMVQAVDLTGEICGIAYGSIPVVCEGKYEEVEFVMNYMTQKFPQYKVRENPPTSR